MRRSRWSVTKSAASAAATLTITSPATAADASEVVVGCTEPGGSNECLAGVDSRSYWNGHRRRGVGLCCSLGQVDCGRYCCGRVMRPADAPEEEPNNLIAYDFVNDAVMSSDRIGCQLIEAVEECVEGRWAQSFS